VWSNVCCQTPPPAKVTTFAVNAVLSLWSQSYMGTASESHRCPQLNASHEQIRPDYGTATPAGGGKPPSPPVQLSSCTLAMPET